MLLFISEVVNLFFLYYKIKSRCIPVLEATRRYANDPQRVNKNVTRNEKLEDRSTLSVTTNIHTDIGVDHSSGPA